MARFLAFFFVLFCGASLAAAPRYYFVMFGTQATSNIDFRLLRLPEFMEAISLSHSFGTFVAVDDGRITREITISWLPAPGYFGPGFRMPKWSAVPGHNYSLDETLSLVRNKGLRQWGPYEISPELWARASAREAYLSRSLVKYQLVGNRGRNVRVPSDHNHAGGAINCIMAFHGVGAFAETEKDFGWRASRRILAAMAATGTGQIREFPYGVRHDIARLMRLAERALAQGLQAIPSY